jgi:hypothetical protein
MTEEGIGRKSVTPQGKSTNDTIQILDDYQMDAAKNISKNGRGSVPSVTVLTIFIFCVKFHTNCTKLQPA